MKLESAKIKHFGTIAGPMKVDFSEGLNVIHGPNESGKSTLMTAVWFAFTRRSSSNASDIREIRPYSGETPEVTVAFSAGGATYTLFKEFKSSTGKTHLHVQKADGSVEELNETAADRRVREVLGWSDEADRSGVPEHYGLWPLIWVKQGEDGADPGQMLRRDGSDAKLSETLGSLTGQVLTGAGDEALFDKIKAEYERYYTATGTETTRSGAPLYEARQAREDAQAELDELLADQARYEDDLEQYRRLEKDRERLENQTLPRLQREKDEAQRKLEEVGELVAQKETADARLEAARGKVERLEQIRDARREMREELAELAAAREQAREALEEQQRVVDAEREKRPGLLDTRDAASEAVAAAKRQAGRLDAWLERLDAARERDKLADEVERAKRVHEELVDKRAQLAESRVDEATLDKLDRRRRAYEQKKAALEVAAARLKVRALDDVELTVEGATEALGADDELQRTIDAPMTLRVADLVELEITPGGEHLVDAREALEKAKGAYQTALEALGVDDYEHARRLSRERMQLAEECKSLEKQLQEFAPKGETDLETQLSKANKRFERASQDYERLTESDDDALADDAAECRELRREARAELERREDALKKATGELNAHDRLDEVNRKELKHTEERVAELDKKLDARRARLEAHVEQHGDDDGVETQLTEARERVEALAADVAAVRDKLEAIRADDVADLAKQRNEAVRSARSELQKTSEQLAGLKATLGSAKLHGLHGRIEEAKHSLDEAGAEEARRERDAQAARLLYETVDRARSQTRKQYLEPLRTEAADLLQRIFKNGQVEFGDDFSIAKLSRKSADEFGALSFGAREQLGLVVRIAAARLLAKQGVRMPLFLDDVLSSTDRHRFERMGRILRHAAEDLQIIITTCHKSRFIELGAATRYDLEDLKRQVTPVLEPAE